MYKFCNYLFLCLYSFWFSMVAQVEKMDSECNQLQQELQDSRDQNELLEFRILELEVSHKESLLNRNVTLTFIIYYAVQMLLFLLLSKDIV